ncbi:MAG: hypothetical protein ABH885_03975 [Candidatus Omnitrophota bacterium]
MRNIFRLSIILMLIFALAGCKATFPKETLAQSIAALCLEEYGLEIKAEVIGQTLAVYLPLKSLLDLSFGLSEEAQDAIQDVLLSASRVVLSTDADIRFYCVIAQDIRLPELQVIVIKSVEDVKRAYFNDISRGEYLKRTIFDININPQSRKEQTIKDVFKKYKLDPEWQDQILEEFFRNTPLALKDFGYWNDRFYVKNITLPEFIAEQIVYRIRMHFRENKELARKYVVKAVNARYEEEGNARQFRVDFDIKLNEVLKVLGEAGGDDGVIFGNVMEEIADCVYGYKFEDFDSVKCVDAASGKKLTVSKNEIYALKKRKINMDNVLAGLS